MILIFLFILIRLKNLDKQNIPISLFNEIFERSAFRGNFVYNNYWNGTFYNNKQIEAIAVEENYKWVVITVIVKYF